MKSITETIKSLISSHGEEILQQPQRLKAMLADLLPNEKRMRYLLDLSLQADMPKKLMAIQNETSSVWDTNVSSIKYYFKEEYFLEDKPIKMIFDCWVEVLPNDRSSNNLSQYNTKHNINPISQESKQLVVLSEFEIINNLVLAQPKWFFSLISCFHPLPLDLMQLYLSRLDWNNLSRNINLNWNEALIEKYIYSWNWDILSKNKTIPWSKKIIQKYENRWNWDNLSSNPKLPWNVLVELHIHAITSSAFYKRIDIELIDMYERKLNWTNLSSNKGLPWDEKLIEKYQNKWNWHWLSCNSSIPWSAELIDKYIDKWDWHYLSGNSSIPWSAELIDKYIDKWDWQYLSGNSSIPWSAELIDKSV